MRKITFHKRIAPGVLAVILAAGSLLAVPRLAHAEYITDLGLTGLQPGDPGQVDPNNSDDWADLQYGEVDTSAGSSTIWRVDDLQATVADFEALIPGQRVYDYLDSDGPGKMKIVPGKFNPRTGSTPIQVKVAQNGQVVQGSGDWVRLRSGRYRLTFTVNVQGFPFRFLGLMSASRRTAFGLYDGWGYEDTWMISS